MTANGRNPQELIQQHQGLVRSLATQIRRKLPPYLELDDLIAYGQVGLAEAARDFDPARGIQFSTYAYYRVRGAIYDGLSKMTWFSRTQYKQVRCQQMSNEVLRVEGEQAEADSQSGVDPGMGWFRDVTRALAVVYLATQYAGDDRQPTSLADSSTPSPPAAAIGHELAEKIRELVDALPTEAGTLIRATYFEGLTLEEAGKRLGVSKSWASRLHAKTLQRLAHSLRLLGVAS